MSKRTLILAEYEFTRTVMKKMCPGWDAFVHRYLRWWHFITLWLTNEMREEVRDGEVGEVDIGGRVHVLVLQYDLWPKL